MKPLWMLCITVVLLLQYACNTAPADEERPANTLSEMYVDTTQAYFAPLPTQGLAAPYAFLLVVQHDVKVKQYYAFVDSVVATYAPLVPYPLTEYVFVHANPWIIDTLVSFDYYHRMAQGVFVYDQKEMTVLCQGQVLLIPQPPQADSIQRMLDSVVIDVNIPEYVLRIMVDGRELYQMPVRVGRDEKKYLAMAGREVSLRTPIGAGEIIRIVRDPWYVNPVDNKRYYGTNRDDKRYTQLPLVPWLEPTIDGRRQGSLIHPTTNQATLGKSYSNACVGTPEGMAWITYYHAPLGTKVNFRYQLQVVNEEGDTVQLEDIYHLQK